MWAGAPPIVGACFAAASWGQISWWPGAALAVVYGLRLLTLKPRAVTREAALPAEPEFAVSSFGVISHDDNDGVCLPWSDVTRVDMVADTKRQPGSPVFFELIGRNRKLVVPAREAVVGQLVQAMNAQLGLLDEVQFLRALSHGVDGSRFTVWQRLSAA
jgi:hypothetical protein